MIQIIFSIILFAFCINVGMYFIGNALHIETVQVRIPQSTNATLFNQPNGTASGLLDQVSQSAGFSAGSLLGSVTGPLEAAYNLFSAGYLINIMQTVGGFPEEFVTPMQAIWLLLTIIVGIQLVRGLIFT